MHKGARSLTQAREVLHEGGRAERLLGDVPHANPVLPHEIGEAGMVRRHTRRWPLEAVSLEDEVLQGVACGQSGVGLLSDRRADHARRRRVGMPNSDPDKGVLGVQV